MCTAHPRRKWITRHQSPVLLYFRSFSSLWALGVLCDKAHVTPFGRWFDKNTQHCFILVRRALVVQQRFFLCSFSFLITLACTFGRTLLLKVVTDVTEQFLGRRPWFNSTKQILRTTLMSDRDFGTQSEKSCTTIPTLSRAKEKHPVRHGFQCLATSEMQRRSSIHKDYKLLIWVPGRKWLKSHLL